jgi:hypothetical protein
MKLRAAMSVPREKLLEFKADGMKKLIDGVLHTSRLNFPKVQQALNHYLLSVGLRPDDKSVIAWLEENSGPLVGIFILEPTPNQITFRIHSGTAAELRQIGEQHEEGNHSQRTTGVRKVNMGKGARVVKPGFVQEG